MLISELNKWDQRFLLLAKHVSSWSKDPSTKVGAVVANGKKLLSVGFNGFPPQIEDREEWLNDRPTKYSQIIHAEVNAIINANSSFDNCSIYVYPLLSCPECTKFIIARGFSSIYNLFNSNSSLPLWSEQGLISQQICERAGVEYIIVQEH